METATLSSKGQLVIPKSVRRSAQILAGQTFSVRWIEGEIRLARVIEPHTVQLSDVAGCLAKPGKRRMTDTQLRQAMLARIKAQNETRNAPA